MTPILPAAIWLLTICYAATGSATVIPTSPSIAAISVQPSSQYAMQSAYMSLNTGSLESSTSPFPWESAWTSPALDSLSLSSPAVPDTASPAFETSSLSWFTQSDVPSTAASSVVESSTVIGSTTTQVAPASSSWLSSASASKSTSEAPIPDSSTMSPDQSPTMSLSITSVSLASSSDLWPSLSTFVTATSEVSTTSTSTAFLPSPITTTTAASGSVSSSDVSPSSMFVTATSEIFSTTITASMFPSTTAAVTSSSVVPTMPTAGTGSTPPLTATSGPNHAKSSSTKQRIIIGVCVAVGCIIAAGAAVVIARRWVRSRSQYKRVDFSDLLYEDDKDE